MDADQQWLFRLLTRWHFESRRDQPLAVRQTADMLCRMMGERKAHEVAKRYHRWLESPPRSPVGAE